VHVHALPNLQVVLLLVLVSGHIVHDLLQQRPKKSKQVRVRGLGFGVKG
jgi:hypothetical protein